MAADFFCSQPRSAAVTVHEVYIEGSFLEHIIYDMNCILIVFCCKTKSNVLMEQAYNITGVNGCQPE